MSKGPSAFTGHRIRRMEGSLHVRDYAGTGPTFVLMHDVPGNLQSWDDLIPYLAEREMLS
jgi:haloalkane dehalogenase